MTLGRSGGITNMEYDDILDIYVCIVCLVIGGAMVMGAI